MIVRSKNQFAMLDSAISQCEGSVVLSDARSGEDYDLKNPAERAKAYARLAVDYGETLELFVHSREDTQIMLAFMDELYRSEARKMYAEENAAYQERKRA